jgi:predicted small lipoprotein YifL
VTSAQPPVLARRAASLFLLAGLALGVSGCGRAGPLEAPPNPHATATPSSDNPTAGLTRPKSAPIVPPKQPFLLDPLL